MIATTEIFRWLIDTAAACALLLTLAHAAMLLVRQPARRHSIAEFALAACLLLALLQALPATRVSLGIVNVGQPVQLPWLQDISSAAAPAIDNARPQPVSPSSASPSPVATPRPVRLNLLQYWRQALLTLYAAGALLMTIRLFTAFLGLRRLARCSAPPAPPLAALWQNLTRGHDPIRLAISPQVDRPITFGLRRPIVILPAIVAGASPRDLLPLLRHELAHIERRDALAWLLAAAASILLFFLPPLWLIKHQMRLAQEFLVDHAVAESAGGPVAYSEMLLRLVNLTTARSATPALALAAWSTPSDLLLRIRHLLNLRGALEPRCTRRCTLIIATAMLLLSGTLGAFTLADHSLAARVRTTELEGVEFLLRTQNPAGGWLTDVGPAPTALVVRSLLQAGVPADHPAISRARAYVDSCRQSDGGYYTDGEPTYHTAIVLSMYSAFQDPQAQSRLLAGQHFLERDRLTAHSPEHSWYDMATSSDSPTHAFRFADPSERAADAILDTYGSLTYTRWKSLIYANLAETDPRNRDAYRWLVHHWTLDKHPGTGSAEGLYYYYLAAAKTLRASSTERFSDPAGHAHAWRDELQDHLRAAQSFDGSWRNTQSPRWLEDRRELVTAYALLALQETRK